MSTSDEAATSFIGATFTGSTPRFTGSTPSQNGEALRTAEFLTANEQLPTSVAELNVLAATLESMRALGRVFDRTMIGLDGIGPELRTVTAPDPPRS